MPREKTYVPVTRGDLKEFVKSGILAIGITERKVKGAAPDAPKRKVRRFILAEGRNIADLVNALPTEVVTRCLLDGINREIYFNAGAGAASRLEKQAEKLRKQLAAAEELQKKLAQETE